MFGLGASVWHPRVILLLIDQGASNLATCNNSGKYEVVTDLIPTAYLPPAAVREFENVRNSDWKGGVPLPELLSRVNRVAASFLPEQDRSGSGAGRVKRTFTDRSFRHYQTLGCIDVPEKDGRRSRYGLRHFVQALLVRRLLWQRVPSDQIAGLVAGRSLKDTEKMFLGGVEIVAQEGGKARGQWRRSNPYLHALRACASNSVSGWIRAALAPGIELHLSDKPPQLTPEEKRRLVKRIVQLVQGHIS